MGNHEVVPATQSEIDAHFAQDAFKISECWDIERFKDAISNLPLYVGGQKALEELWSKKVSNLRDFEKMGKKFTRGGMPDSKRRLIFLEQFELEAQKCKLEFKVVLEGVNKEEIEIAAEDKPSKPFLHTLYLNDKGMEDLEIIIHLLNKEYNIEYSPTMINSVAILLIYCPVEETYCIMHKMMEKSKVLMADPKTKKLMRWYFSVSKADYFQMLGAFIQSYIDTTKLKKRSILIKLQQLGFDINELLDEMFKYFFTSLMKIDYAIDIFTLFYLEGVKVLFRFAYATFKHHKETIKSIEKAENVKPVFERVWTEETKWSILHEKAFKYSLQRGHYDINRVDQVVLDDEREEYKIVSDFLPNTDDWPSKILSLKQFYRLWMMLPEYCQVRVPNLLYSSAVDGYNLSTLYQKWKPYQEKVSVKFVFVIIRTLEGDIFGVFLDTVIYKSIKEYMGSQESFIFGFYEDKRITHYATKKNNQYCIGGMDYLQFGGGDEGPAIYLKDSLQEGQTNVCETFGNEVLTSDKNNFFKVQSIELIMI